MRQLIGVLPRLTDPLVVECRSANGMASGPLPWTLAGRLRERLPRAEVLIADGPESLAGLAASLAAASWWRWCAIRAGIPGSTGCSNWP